MVKMNLYDYFGNVLWHQHRCLRIGIMAPTDFVHNVLDWDHIFSDKFLFSELSSYLGLNLIFS